MNRLRRKVHFNVFRKTRRRFQRWRHWIWEMWSNEQGRKNIRKRWNFKRRYSLVNFTNILRAAFAPISFGEKNTNLALSREKLLKIFLYKKAACKMLVKLTPGQRWWRFKKESWKWFEVGWNREGENQWTRCLFHHSFKSWQLQKDRPHLEIRSIFLEQSPTQKVDDFKLRCHFNLDQL